MDAEQSGSTGGRGRRLAAVRAVAVLLVLALAGCAGPAPHPAHRQQILAALPSPDGARVFIVWRAEQGRGFWGGASLVALAGPRSREVWRSEAPFHDAGSWSPNGRLFASVVGAEGDSTPVMVDASTGEYQSIPTGLEARAWVAHPRWSPDGSTILYEAVPGDSARVLSYSVGTDQVKSVAAGHLLLCGNPFWGEGFVYSVHAGRPTQGTQGLDRYRFYWRPTRAGGEVELLPGHVVERITVSPEGRRAAALCLPAGAVGQAPGPSAGYEMRLVPRPDDPGGKPVAGATFSNADPEWSPSGRRLLALLWQDPALSSSPALAVVDATTGQVHALTRGPGKPVRGVRPYWVSEECFIYIRRNALGADEIWQYDLATRREGRVYP